MTDIEKIKKASECCPSEDEGSCFGCPYVWIGSRVDVEKCSTIAGDACDAITSLEAEIKRLKADNDELLKQSNGYATELVEAKKTIVNLETEIEEQRKELDNRQKHEQQLALQIGVMRHEFSPRIDYYKTMRKNIRIDTLTEFRNAMVEANIGFMTKTEIYRIVDELILEERKQYEDCTEQE